MSHKKELLRMAIQFRNGLKMRPFVLGQTDPSSMDGIFILPFVYGETLYFYGIPVADKDSKFVSRPDSLQLYAFYRDNILYTANVLLGQSYTEKDERDGFIRTFFMFKDECNKYFKRRFLKQFASETPHTSEYEYDDALEARARYDILCLGESELSPDKNTSLPDQFIQDVIAGISTLDEAVDTFLDSKEVKKLTAFCHLVNAKIREKTFVEPWKLEIRDSLLREKASACTVDFLLPNGETHRIEKFSVRYLLQIMPGKEKYHYRYKGTNFEAEAKDIVKITYRKKVIYERPF